MRVFDERVKNEYVDTVRKMCCFVDGFIDAGGDIKKDELLVKALVELIALDNYIDDSQSFYIREDGTTAQKKELVNMKEIPLQSFLLGVFHYAVCNVDNTAGAETFEIWCPSTGGGKRAYTGDIGVNWPVDIKLSYIEFEDDNVADNQAYKSPDDIIVEEVYEESRREEEKSKQQMVFNFNVTGNNNSFIQHVDSITNNYYGRQKKMENKLQPSQPGALQTQTPNTTFNLPGNNNTLVAHTDAVNNTYSVMMVGGALPMPGSPNAANTITLNTDFYNLLVVGNDELNPQDCHCLVRKDRVITESTSKELKAAYATLSDDAISTLKTYPAIIATENHAYGKTDADHYAAYGLIVDVKIQDNGIKVYYQILNWIPQQKINELRFELGIEGCSGTNELNRMHWAVKKINAVEVLREAGISVFSL